MANYFRDRSTLALARSPASTTRIVTFPSLATDASSATSRASSPVHEDLATLSPELGSVDHHVAPLRVVVNLQAAAGTQNRRPLVGVAPNPGILMITKRRKRRKSHRASPDELLGPVDRVEVLVEPAPTHLNILTRTFAFSSPASLCSGVPVLLFCQCGSDRIDIAQWNGQRARIRCLSCNGEAWLDGFTVSDFEPAKLLVSAMVDQARKHRRRSPTETAKIQSARTGAGRR
jgi:hypothetical protein